MKNETWQRDIFIFIHHIGSIMNKIELYSVHGLLKFSWFDTC